MKYSHLRPKRGKEKGSDVKKPIKRTKIATYYVHDSPSLVDKSTPNFQEVVTFLS